MDRFTAPGQQKMPGVIQFQDSLPGDHYLQWACRLAQPLIMGPGFYPRGRLPAAQQINDYSLFHHALRADEIREPEAP
jgi:hypothetical protein